MTHCCLFGHFLGGTVRSVKKKEEEEEKADDAASTTKVGDLQGFEVSRE